MLDNTAVHPESYDKARQLMKELGITSQEIMSSSKDAIEKLESAANREMAQKLDVGLPTLRDIISELKKPGRDIRESVSPVILKSDVLDIDDLSIGTQLQGTVRNVVDFGAFVDIGLKNDGLVHVSELSNSYVKDPMSVVSVGDIVDVRVIGIDRERNKVKLSMKKQK